MIEVMRTTKHGYEMCKVLTPRKENGDMPKYIMFQSSKNADIFVGQISMGCWCEMKIMDVEIWLNEYWNRLQDLKKIMYEFQEIIIFIGFVLVTTIVIESLIYRN